MNIIEKIMNDLGWYRRPKPKKKRICIICGNQIKRNEKWFNYKSGPAHRNCYPTVTNDVQEKLPL